MDARLVNMFIIVLTVAVIGVFAVFVAVPGITVAVCVIAVIILYIATSGPLFFLQKLGQIAKDLNCGNIHADAPEPPPKNVGFRRIFSSLVGTREQMKTLQHEINEMSKNTGAGKQIVILPNMSAGQPGPKK